MGAEALSFDASSPRLRLVHAVYEAKREEERQRGAITFPAPQYRDDPIGFCRDVLGFAPTRTQARIMQAFVDHDHVTTRSGRKVAKSRSCASLALWWYATREASTVVLVAPTETQIREIVWHEFSQLFASSGTCLACRVRFGARAPRPCMHSACIDGELSVQCRTGLHSGARRVFGMAPRKADNARGISGPDQLWLLDEASGIADGIAETAEANLTGGGKIGLFGNPVSRRGFFYASHHSKPYYRIRVSSLESPNVVLGRTVVPGLAEAKACKALLEEVGEDDARYQVEVLGEFPSRDAARLITDVELAEAFNRGEAMADDPEGPLYLGVDPAGGGQGGDDSTIVARRGRKVFPILAFKGGTDLIMLQVEAQIRRLRRHEREPVTINFDAASYVGAELKYALQNLKMRDDSVRFDPLESRGDARHDPLLRSSGCARPRDAYWLNMTSRIKADIALPFDEELRAELLFAEWQENREEGSRLIEKKRFRQMLGRSPDRADALCYCLWEGRVMRSGAAAEVVEGDHGDDARPPKPHDVYDVMTRRGGGLDPYSGGRWRR